MAKKTITEEPKPKPKFIVKARQYVELRIPDSVAIGYGLSYADFVKTYSAEDATELAAALKRAALELS